MAIVKAVVLKNGQLQRLQPGDVLAGPTVNDAIIQQTFLIATAGTDAAAAAYSLASHAELVAEAGTNAAAAAYATAAAALAATGTSSNPSTSFLTLLNNDNTAHVLGDIVYNDSADGAKRGKADSISTSDVVAFSVGSNAPAHQGSYQVDGVLAGFSGLIPGAYYLSVTTAGTMTSTAPDSSGVLVRVGNATSSSRFKINIEPSILL